MIIHTFKTVSGLTVDSAEDHLDAVVRFYNDMDKEGQLGMSEITGLRKEFHPDTELPTNGTTVALALNGVCIGFGRYRVQPEEMGITFLSVSNLYIDAPYRGKGYSKKLLSYFHEVGKKNHCNAMVLNVTSNNTVAIKLYSKQGFKEAAKVMVCKI